MAAEDLVGFLVRGLVDSPDQVEVTTIEGKAANIVEVRVNPDDIELVEGDDGETLRHIRAVVSASAGRTKTLVELLEGGAGPAGEE